MGGDMKREVGELEGEREGRKGRRRRGLREG